MTQNLLPFQLCEASTDGGQTAWAGIGTILELTELLHIREVVDKHVGLRTDNTSWPDSVIAMTVIVLQLCGGSCVDDVERLAADEGLCRLFEQAILHACSRARRRRLRRRIRLAGGRPFPSAPTIRRWLEGFEHAEDVAPAVQGRTRVVDPSSALAGLWRVNCAILDDLQARAIERSATLDMDATLIESHKRDALWCYKGFPGYQPMQVWWAEQEMLVHSEFRDGNVPAGQRQLAVLKDSLTQLPSSVRQVSMRSDTAGYQVRLMRYCAEGRNRRFGVIPFGISCDVTEAFKQAVSGVRPDEWQRLSRVFDNGDVVETSQQWAEVTYVPEWAATSTNGPSYRFVAIREPMRPTLPGLDAREPQESLPFPTHVFGDGQRYKLFGIVTNIDAEEMSGDALIWWHRKRNGRSEQFHDIVKNDLAGGTMPSGTFGANAAWWALSCVTANLVTFFRRLAAPARHRRARMKRLRFDLLSLAGRVCRHARQLWVRLRTNHPSLPVLIGIRAKLARLAAHPPDN